jgi:hypothetical protein
MDWISSKLTYSTTITIAHEKRVIMNCTFASIVLQFRYQ